jgi:PBP1b-binding outer membrane lipoprotein LpoB
MKMLKYALVVSLAFMFVACSTVADKSAIQQNTQQSATVQTEKSGGGGDSEGQKAKEVESLISLDVADKSKAEPVPAERKIIRNAELTLEADSPDDASANITKVVEKSGGFVVESQKQTSDAKATKSDSVTMIVRVPSAKFEESLDEIRKLSGRVITEAVKGQDVTEEFIDVEARLKSKKALESQFLEIMKQGKTVEDALNVQRELADVRGEIEQIEGKKRFLENQSSLSTIKLRLQMPTVFSANSSGFFYQLAQSFSSGFEFALNFILGLITFVIAILPFLLFIVLPIFLILRYFWRKKNNAKLAEKIFEEELKNE